MHISPYLTFNGDCEQAFAFYADVFGVTPTVLMRFKDFPGPKRTPDSYDGKIMHAQINIGAAQLMGSDRHDDHYAKPQGLMVSLTVDTPAEAERIFNELSAGGEITMPMAETFWAQRFGMLVDRFGIPFMIGCDKSG
jgi:PhnB protein